MHLETKGLNLLITINNFNLSYNDVGEGRVPLIFLHGFPFDKTMWDTQLESLKNSYRLIAIDIRGFGNSVDEESILSMDCFSDDLIKFMDKLHIDKAIVCGLSMGGYIALHVLKGFSNRFEALILCDTQCIADTDEVKAKRLKTIEEISKNGVSDFNEGFIKNVFCKQSLENKKELVDHLKIVVFSNSQHIISQGLLALAGRSETCSTLSEINIPTLIICGKEDAVTPLSQSEFMHENIKGSILKVIENAGHVSNLEQPQEFNKHLNDFLSDLSGINNEGMSENLLIDHLK